MEKNPGHQPQRFEEYVELPDGKGFTIKDTKHVFYYDRFGGWNDQFGNYYNSDGKPDDQPESASQKSISNGSWSSDEDQFEKQFGPSTQVQEEFEKQPVLSQAQILVQQTIAKNVELLDHYVKQQPLRVNFQILDDEDVQQLPTEKQLTQGYKKKVKGVINVFYEQKASGYFVVSKKSEALLLINLQGQNIVGCDISFEVQHYQEFLHDPLSQVELQQTLPKFVDIDQSQKIYTIHLQNHAGFGSKQLYKDWMKRAKKAIQKFDVIKMRSNEKKQKIPIVKLTDKQVASLKQVLYQGKQVVIQQYKPLKKQQQGNQQTNEKTQVAKTSPQEKKQESTQQSNTAQQ